MAEADLLHWSKTHSSEVSAKLPHPYEQLLPDDCVAITKLSMINQIASVQLSHPLSDRHPQFLVRWAASAENIDIALIQIIEPGVDPSESTAVDTIVRVVNHSTLALLTEEQFLWSLSVLQESVTAASDLPGVDWNRTKWTAILKAFGQPPALS